MSIKLTRTKSKKVGTKKLDTLFSKIIRSAGRCKRCGSTFNLQCAHIISRRYHQVRWNLDNALCLCAGCHMYFTYHPLEWEDYIDGLGIDYAKLKKQALAYGKIDHKAIYEQLLEQ